MEKVLEKITDGIVDFSGKLLLGLIIILVGFKIVKFIMKRLKKGIAFNKLEKSSQTFIASIVNIVLKGIIVITAVTTMGIPMTTVITVIGSFGLALGLALQGGLSNIAGGVMIMIFKPFKVGDFIDTHTDSGTVTEINIFHTVIVTLDNKVVVLPNGNLSNSVVVNYTKNDKRRLEFNFSVSYDSDIDKVKDILNKVAKESGYELADTETVVGLDTHGDSALVFVLKMWINTKDYWDARYTIPELVKKAFDKNKISIPYPQMDVHLDK